MRLPLAVFPPLRRSIITLSQPAKHHVRDGVQIGQHWARIGHDGLREINSPGLEPRGCKKCQHLRIAEEARMWLHFS